MISAAHDAMTTLAPLIIHALPPGWSYALVLFQDGTDSVTSVSSNAPWPSLIVALRHAADWVDYMHGQHGTDAALLEALRQENAELRQQLDEVTDRERDAHRWESR